MNEISTNLIGEAVYNLCFKANVCLSKNIYEKIYDALQNCENVEIRGRLQTILQNAKIAYENKRPLCQDTGQVIVFLEIGQDVKIVGDLIQNVVNEAVSQCYVDNYFRKSVVKNAVFDRDNTGNNTPAIVYTDIISGNSIKISILIKGAGSENKSAVEMMLPTDGEEEIIRKIGDLILKSGVNSCPPMFIGVGIGATADYASVLSKRAFVSKILNEKDIELANKIKKYVNSKSPENYVNQYVLDVKLISSATHIACMPVAVTINCHSDRVSSCIIENNNNIIYEHEIPEFINFELDRTDIKEVYADDIETIRNLKEGEEILLTGEIYTARDMAHKKLQELIDKKKDLPIKLKDKIIFYAGPCPNKPDEIIGSVGPTTSSRMDKYSVNFYDNGMLASIGKGSRSIEVENSIKKNKAKYFIAIGGCSALYAKKVKSSNIVAFEELGTEAIFSLYVEKFPLKVQIG